MTHKTPYCHYIKYENGNRGDDSSTRMVGDQGASNAVVVTGSQSMLRKIEQRMLRKEWLTLLDNSMVGITWTYCPGHAGVIGNERVYRLLEILP